MKYGTVNLGQIEALLNKIGGMQGMQAILRGKLQISLTWKCWRTVRLGEHPTAASLRKALADKGYDKADCLEIRDDIHIMPGMSVDLVLVKVSDLGFEDGACAHAIYEAARQIGLICCPEETAAQLLLQGVPADVPTDDRLCLQIATDPIVRDGNGYRIFRHNGKLHLARFSNGSLYRRDGFESFVFARGAQAKS